MSSPIVLRPYQEEAFAEIKKGWQGNRLGNTFQRQLLVLATGLGKTICFAALAKWIANDLNGRVLVLAHREELLEQAEIKMTRVFGTDIVIGREQASSRASVMFDQVVTASVATLGRSVVAKSEREFRDGKLQAPQRPNDRLARFPKNHFKAIIIDEAHHATAETYQNIIRYFAEGNPDCWVLGVTATPKRSDKESLHKVFDRVAYKLDIVDGTKQGFLTPIVAHRISSKTDLNGVKTTAGDFNIKDLADRVNNAERNSLVVQTYLDNLKDQQCIVYATDLDHAHALDAEFERQGVISYAISGDMDKEERRTAIRKFLNGEIMVLTNYGVLTEGFDYDVLAHIICARPTKSNLLLTQIMGRETRLLSDESVGKGRSKPVAHFWEIIDNHSEETATAAEIFGFKQTFDCQGHSFLECIELSEKYEKEKEFFNPWICKTYQEIVDRFARATDRNPTGSASAWAETDAESVGKTADRFDSRYRYYATSGGAFKLIHNDRGPLGRPSPGAVKYVVRLEPDGMGGYNAVISSGATRLFMFSGGTVAEAAQKVESCIQSKFNHWDMLLNINAGWRKKAEGEPVTEKQWGLISKFRMAPGRTRGQVTKAEAMEIISKHFNK